MKFHSRFLDRAPAGRGGFSLIELQITLVMLLVGVLSLAGTMGMAMRNQLYSRQRLQITRALASKFEEVGKTTFDKLISTYNGTTFQMYPAGLSLTGQISVTSLNAHLISVKLSTSWTAIKGNETLSLYQEFGK